MTHYTYRAKTGPSQIQTGELEAVDEKEAVQKIMQRGFIPLDVEVRRLPTKSPKASSSFFFWTRIKSAGRAVRQEDRSAFLRPLNDLIDADVPLLKALSLTLAQTRKPPVKDILSRVTTAVQNGDSLSEALKNFPELFPAYVVTMIRIGEMSGHLKIVLARLAEYAEKEDESRRKLTMSLIYPAIVLGMGFLTVFILLTFVIPKLAVMFADMGQRLPFVTRILIAISQICSRYWEILIAAVAVFILGWKRFASFPQGQRTLDRLILKIPFWGTFVRIQNLERLVRMLGLLLGNGVPLTTALEEIEMISDNEVIRFEVKALSQKIIAGERFASALASGTFLSPEQIGMMSIGEETGHLDSALNKVAQQLETQSERLVRTSTTFMEPVLILIIGAIVGFMVVALLMPVFEMNVGSAGS